MDVGRWLDGALAGGEPLVKDKKVGMGRGYGRLGVAVARVMARDGRVGGLERGVVDWWVVACQRGSMVAWGWGWGGGL